MRYFAAMGIRVPALAALLGLIFITATVAPAAQVAPQRGAESTSPAIRSASGASANFTVSARIIRESASVGAGRGPPLAHMVPRATSISAADGRAVPALVYDFE